MKQTEDVAIIGWQVRFPGANSIEEYWQNLRNGVESISFFNEAELQAAGYSLEAIRNPAFIKAAPIIERIEDLDASFFGFSPRDAEIVDPQIRIFIEQAWTALEDAGYDAERYPGRIGVFAGANISRYYLDSLKPLIEQEAHRVSSTVMTLCFNDKDALATLVSYKLNLRGPAVTVQSFCSTSLVAVHMGCQSLIMGDSDMVIAGGSNLHTRNASGYHYREGDILSPDGHCRPFDADGRGTLFGSGAGAVILKRLSDALADGDTIHALIKGSAVNNDGSVKAGYTAPSIEGQSQAVARALEVSGVDPETIGFVEAHGTATEVGDPIEVAALTKAFRARTEKRQYCALGSVKSNFGHLDRAAGVSSLVKAVLAVEHGQIPPTVNFKQPNPKIDFEGSPFFVNGALLAWPNPTGPRRAGVSGLGFGGTNAHVILEQAPEVPASGPSRSHQLLVLSARTETALATAAGNLAKHLQKNPGVDLADVANTLQRGRRAFPHRQAVVAASAEAATSALEAGGSGAILGSEMVSARRESVFLFPGQGAQYVGMARGLYDGEPVFRSCVDECAELLRGPLAADLRDVLYPAAGADIEKAAERLKQTAFTQPALFVVEYALARLLGNWGLRPKAMIGHSIGEYVAACLAGVMRLEDALQLVALRGRLMQSCAPGAMLAVMADEERVTASLGEGLSLAAVNAPGLCVVAGSFEHISGLESKLKAEAIDSRRLETSHAFHSGMMDGILAEFEQAVASVRLQEPRIPFASNVTGRFIEAREATDPRYWIKHLRHTVRFADGLEALVAGSSAALVEVGPGKALTTFARRLGLDGEGRPVVVTMRHAKEDVSDVSVLLRSLGGLWVAGVDVDWDGFLDGERRRRVPLPTYPFERSPFWLQPEPGMRAPQQTAVGKQADIGDWFSTPSWRRVGGASNFARLVEKLAGRPWMVLGDDGPLVRALGEKVLDLGQPLIRVRFGDQFRETAPGSYVVAAGKAEDFAALFENLQQKGSLPTFVVHAGNVGEGGVGEAQDRAFFSPLFLVQELGKRKVEGGARLAMLSDGLHSVLGEPVVRPERATLLGPCRVTGREYGEIQAVNIDLLPAEAVAGDARLVERVVAEVATPGSDPVVAFRADQRWVLGYERSPLATAPQAELPFKQGGVYIVTGGTGGIGLTVAQHLAERYQAKLVLTSRSGMPDASDERQKRKAAAIQELQSKSEVLVCKADVADAARMKQVFEETEARFGRIDGVLHTAGVPGGGVIQLKKREVAERVLEPKVKGTLVLDALLKDRKPDLVVLFSSAAAVGGPFGQVDYCAANCFMDAFAAMRHQAGGPLWTSINWDDWAEVGMAVETSSRLGVETAGLVPVASEDVRHPIFSRKETKPGEVAYVASLSEKTSWLLTEHVLFGMPTVPGSAFLEFARAAYELETGQTTCELRNLFLARPLAVPKGETREMRVVLRTAEKGYDFVIESHAAGSQDVERHVEGRVLPFAGSGKQFDVAELERSTSERRIEGATLVAGKKANPDPTLMIGPRWSNVRHVCYGGPTILGFHELASEFRGDVDAYKLHPAVTDFTALYPLQHTPTYSRYVPISYTSVRVSAPIPQRVLTLVHMKDDTAAQPVTMRFNCTFLDESGRELVAIEDLTLHKMEISRAGEAPTENFTVALETPGVLESLKATTVPRRPPAKGEVEIRVAAAGLNFRDVLRALGMLSAEHDAGAGIVGFGAECSGKIVAVGEGVTDLAVGDDVLAFATRAISRYVTTSAKAVAVIPERLNFHEAASIPMVFLTAYHGLHRLARLAKGERVLIHAAAGGVGLAAVQVAKWLGAEVFATVGSPEKRAYLETLGVRHIANSRSLDFAEDVRKWTGGEGVDVVLNSLAGEFLTTSLALLRTGGRFIEIGARDIYQNTALGLRPFAAGLTFSAFDLGQLAAAQPDTLRSMLREVLERLDAGDFQPLPIEAYPASEAGSAFRHMAAARHIGKLVITVADLARGIDRSKAAAGATRTSNPSGRDLSHGILPAEGIEALNRALAARLPQIIVTTRNPEALARAAAPRGDASGASSGPAKPAAARKLHPRPGLTTPYKAPAGVEEEAMTRMWCDLLGLEKVGVNDNFFELGGDSLLGIQLIAQVKAQYPGQADGITPASLYEGPTIAELARKLGGAVVEAAAGEKVLTAEERRARRAERRSRSEA